MRRSVFSLCAVVAINTSANAQRVPASDMYIIGAHMDGHGWGVAQRQALQGKENPAGSGRYPEPKCLAMIQHDMMLFDHGMPKDDEKYATDYPAAVGQHMQSTDSAPFQDFVATISLRENERGARIGAGWDPHWHQPTDVYGTFNDKDFLLGMNAAQTTLSAIAQLSGARIGRP